MHRLRLLLVIGFVLTLGASVARSQEGAVVNKDQTSDQSSKSKPKKAKANTASDSHRRHWWSPPHWFHRKHDNTARNQTGKSADNKTAAIAGPAPKTSSSKAGTSTTASATSAPVLKTRTKTGTGAHTATKTAPAPGAATKHTKGLSSRKKTTTTAAKKPVKQDCSAEQAKKGGCQTGKGGQKTTAAAHPS
jgi:hypothetical protein